MIKTNLLTNHVSTESLEVGHGVSLSDNSSNGFSDESETIVKVVLILLVSGCLYGYQVYNIGNLDDVIRQKNAKISRGAADITKLRVEAGKSSELQNEIKKLNEKLNLLDSLSKKRLKELKALDFLQDNIPDGVWLNKITYDGTSVVLKGGAINDKELDVFVKNLDKSQYFKTVILLKAEKVSGQGKGTVNAFEVSSVMGSLD